MAETLQNLALVGLLVGAVAVRFWGALAYAKFLDDLAPADRARILSHRTRLVD